MPENEAVGGHFARQVFFRQRRALIRQLGLIADQDQTSAITFPAQGVDGLCSGLAAADDQDGGNHHAFIAGRDLP